jgi:hypothetical protein
VNRQSHRNRKTIANEPVVIQERTRRHISDGYPPPPLRF